MKRSILAVLLVIAQPADAQLALPSVHLPTLPAIGLPAGGDPTLQAVTSDLDPARLSDLRKLHVLELLRSHPKLLERDPRGAPMVRGELLAFSPSEVALQRARDAGFVVVRERVLGGLNARIVVLRPTPGASTRRGRERLQSLDAAGTYDFNHIYTDSGVLAPAAAADVPTAAEPAAAQRFDAAVSRPGAARLGLIDSGVDTSHPVFRDSVIHQHGCTGSPAPAAHGTAVASLLIGRSARFRGAAPGTELFAADVYCGLPTGGAVDGVADAFDWLVHERVAVINVSLVGPPNAMLEAVVRAVIARGHVVVAAVGNDGPAAPPLYPAAYPDVVGVTAVDARQKVLPEAERGRQVKFAAPGADMVGASAARSYVVVRGTSFACPIVAGLLAAHLHEPDAVGAASAVAELARGAFDLGAPGPDPVYGYGLVGGDLRPEPALAGVRAE